MVSMSMMLRPKKYLEALVMRGLLHTHKGLHQFYHGGSHYYYLCLISLTSLETLNNVEDVATTSNSSWKQLLKSGGEVAQQALADDEANLQDEQEANDADSFAMVAAPVRPTASMPAPKRAKKGDAKLLDAMTCKFKVESQTGVRDVSIGIDGYSHQTKNRRAYSQCCQAQRFARSAQGFAIPADLNHCKWLNDLSENIENINIKNTTAGKHLFLM